MDRPSSRSRSSESKGRSRASVPLSHRAPMPDVLAMNTPLSRSAVDMMVDEAAVAFAANMQQAQNHGVRGGALSAIAEESSRSLSTGSKQSTPKGSNSVKGTGPNDDSDLVFRRLKAAYGFDMPDECAENIAKLQRDCDKKVAPRKLLGRDVNAVAGQVVKHVMCGRRGDGPPSEANRMGHGFEGDFCSGGGLGTITDVCGDNALVRWNNGNQRFYFVGSSPYALDATGSVCLCVCVFWPLQPSW